MSKELVVLRSFIFKRLCFIKRFSRIEVVSPTHVTHNTLALRWNCGQLEQEDVPITFLVAAVMRSLDIKKKSLENKMQNKCNCSGSGQCKRTSFRQLIGTLPRGELAEMADNTFQTFLVCWRVAL